MNLPAALSHYLRALRVGANELFDERGEFMQRATVQLSFAKNSLSGWCWLPPDKKAVGALEES